MMILDGNFTRKQIYEELKIRVDAQLAKGKRPPCLAAILVGEDPASQVYVNNKVRDCEEVGYTSRHIRLTADITEKELLDLLGELNADEAVDGIIVQLPLPAHIEESKVIETIQPGKDVDGFHPINIGRMSKGLSAVLPATPAGIMELLRRYQIPTVGKHCVVIGRSNIVGTPVSILMGRNTEPGNCTVTLCHSHTRDLKAYCLQADILIVAAGKQEFISADMVKPGAVVIDVGMHRVPDASRKTGFRLVGDVQLEDVGQKASAYTPVPGGVGPMTRAMLLMNTWQVYWHKILSEVIS
ncbi:MAG: bifunctional methylenetetrahydrofolate dehydrogenase/methenyltetrahydrofolate cyclohydrolase FolD [Bacteroidetes bacterium]|nr:bifunctional methylenetetrahydrofolate dehydrogenase/methenyltetrahydrofolate cyclohydrolase FolD [Bacteroidota bacterium]